METTDLHNNSLDGLQALVRYLIQSCNDSPSPLSLTKLYKILYFIDFGHYATKGERITTFLYFKLDHGPAPDSLEFLLDIMESEDLVQKKKHIGSQGEWDTYKVDGSLVELEKHFSKDEIATIDKTVKELSKVGAAQLSTLSHWQYSWITSSLNKPIPIESASLCEFPWLGYHAGDEDQDDHKETMRLRKKFADPKRKAKIKKLKNLDFA